MLKPILYLFLLMTFFSISISAQDTVIKKVVYGTQDNVPIESVHVLTLDATMYTNAKGEFKIIFNQFLEFSHVGYDNIIYNNIEEIPDTIWLTRNSIPLDDVTINSKREVGEIEKISKYGIKNFEIVDGHVVVFKKSYLGNKTKLSLYDLEGTLLNELSFDYDFENIVTSCTGQLFLMDETSCFLIQVSHDELVLDSKSSRKDFEKLFEKCVLYYNGEWIYEFEKSKGLERTIVSIIDGKDSVLKKIVLDELIQMKNRNQWKIDLGARMDNITTNDDGKNAYIRDRQEESDFLDKVLLTTHENNSFAVMNDGILIANSVSDSLHFIGNQVIDMSIKINKKDLILNNEDKSKAYFLQKIDTNQYSLSEIDEELNFQKILSLNGEEIFRIRVFDSQVFYLTKNDSNKSVKINLYFESL